MTSDSLMLAIHRYRANVWGDSSVGYPEDADLYQAVGMMDVVEREVSGSDEPTGPAARRGLK